MIRKILKWTGLVIVSVVGIVFVAAAFRQHLTYEAPYPNIKASTDTAVIARGRHLVLGPGHCADCHSPIRNVDSVLKLGQDPALSGGFQFRLPFGTFYSRNLTPDSATGIGNMTDGEIARVLRYSVKKNGEAVLPFMPFQNLSDSDIVAIISYLRSTKPVYNPVPNHDYNILGKGIKAFLIKPKGPTERIKEVVAPDTTEAYGEYMVLAAANCNECHTKRDAIGNYVGEPLAGGTLFEEEGLPSLISPNLTPDPASGRIANWSQETFINRFRQGRMIKHSHMPWESYARMTDLELKAIYNYLRSVKPVNTEVKK